MSEDEPDYQAIAQSLLEYDATVAAEYGGGAVDAVDLARELYDYHGPFELSFNSWRWGQYSNNTAPWYNGGGE